MTVPLNVFSCKFCYIFNSTFLKKRNPEYCFVKNQVFFNKWKFRLFYCVTSLFFNILSQMLVLNEFHNHCVKSVRIRSFSGPYFPAFGLHTDQKNSEYRHFSHSEHAYSIVSQLKYLKKSYSLLFFVIFQPRHSISIKSIQHFFVFFVFTLRY